jgi:hypothetical protein
MKQLQANWVVSTKKRTEAVENFVKAKTKKGIFLDKLAEEM